MSNMDPSETNAENPIFSRKLQSNTAVHKAPDWLKNPTFPLPAIPLAKVALNPDGGHMNPKQLGPNIRIFPRAISRTRFSNAAPSAPFSLNPAK
jgi:hypothetical protein